MKLRIKEVYMPLYIAIKIEDVVDYVYARECFSEAIEKIAIREGRIRSATQVIKESSNGNQA